MTAHEQPSLFPDEPTLDESRLGSNQLAVLLAWKRGGPLTPDEAGAICCELRGRHSRDERCEYDAQQGRQVIASLRKHGYLNSRSDSPNTLGLPVLDEVPY